MICLTSIWRRGIYRHYKDWVLARQLEQVLWGIEVIHPCLYSKVHLIGIDMQSYKNTNI